MIPLISFGLMLFLIAAALAGIEWGGAPYFFAVIVPYAAAGLFLCGVIYRIIRWGLSPVPFRIPATGGQQKSLGWIRTGGTDNPSTAAGVWGRMLLEVLLFRSLFRNMKAERAGEALAYGSSKWLWLGALVFHWSMLAVVLRHLRFFTEPVPAPVAWLQAADGLFETALPPVYLTDITLCAALAYLLGRRLAVPTLRYLFPCRGLPAAPAHHRDRGHRRADAPCIQAGPERGQGAGAWPGPLRARCAEGRGRALLPAPLPGIRARGVPALRQACALRGRVSLARAEPGQHDADAAARQSLGLPG